MSALSRKRLAEGGTKDMTRMNSGVLAYSQKERYSNLENGYAF